MSCTYDMEVTLVVEQDARSRLEALDQFIEKWIETLRDEAEAVDPEQMGLLVKTAKRLAHRLDDNLPPSLDPVALAEIRGILLGGIRRLEEEPDAGPLDVLDDFTVRAESIRHIVRDALDEDIGVDRADSVTLVRLLIEWLPRVTRKQLALLAGVEVRTLQRWAKGEGEASRRLYLVTKLVAILRHAWTPEGVVAWFLRRRPDLEGKKPIELLDDPAYEQLLIQAAREGRAQRGA